LASFLSVIVFSLTALAQTEININKNNIIRIGGDVTITPKQKVENAHAIGRDVTIGEGATVTQTAIFSRDAINCVSTVLQITL
jgi:NDP-sugar pyrophosphorylase family protein